MNTRNKGRILSGSVVLLILVSVLLWGTALYRGLAESRRREAENMLHYYSETILLQLRGTLNHAGTLAQTALLTKDGGTEWFERAAGSLLEREEVRYVCLVEGDCMTGALPEESFGSQVGQDLNHFSYVYTLAKVVKELVVEGPVVLESDTGPQKVFLFLQPIVEENAYLGEVAVALDDGFVLEQLGLAGLSEQGYDYELWRVDPQNGGKEVVAVSRSGVDFSCAAKSTFYLPTQWNLSIQPVSGWVSPANTVQLLLLSLASVLLLTGLAYSLYRLMVQKQALRRLALTDSRTGLYNRLGFTEELTHWLLKGDGITLFYFVFEGYNQISQQIRSEEEAAFLQGIPSRMEEYIKSPFLAGRLGEGNFMLAVRENMGEVQQEEFAKGLALALLLKVRLNGKKHFLTARFQYGRCPPDSRAEGEIASLIGAYYGSPA